MYGEQVGLGGGGGDLLQLPRARSLSHSHSLTHPPPLTADQIVTYKQQFPKTLRATRSDSFVLFLSYSIFSTSSMVSSLEMFVIPVSCTPLLTRFDFLS